MNKVTIALILLIGFLILVVLPINIFAKSEVSSCIVHGTIVDVFVTKKLYGKPFLVITLDNNKKYRLKPHHGLSAGIGDVIEIKVDYFKNRKEDEVDRVFPGLIRVLSYKTLATIIPGTNRKLKYPITIPQK
jgi:hypothetical protein